MDGVERSVCELPVPAVDLEQARAFCEALARDGEELFFRSFDDRGSGGGRNFQGTFEECAVDLQLANGNGSGVFVVVNAGGHRSADITTVRAVFADFDGAPLPSSFVLEPHFIVESSPGRFHVYWMVEGVPLARFKSIQRAISTAYRSDAAVCDLPRVMRIPGFLHHKAAPFRSQVIHESGLSRYSAPEIDSFCAAISPPDYKLQRPSVVEDERSLDSGGSLVAVGRHADLLVLTHRLARLIHTDGLSVSAGMEALRAEAKRGRWTRDVPEDEMRRALEGAVDKFRSGQWNVGLRADGVPQPSTGGATLATSMTARRTLVFNRVDTLLANPRPTQWLMRRRLETDSLALIFGEPGAGKSFLAIDWAVCIATGTPFLGEKTRQGAVLYIAGEGGNGLARRFSACSQAKGLDLSNAPLYVSSMAASLTDDMSLIALQTIVDAHLREHGTPALIIVDTVARNFGPGDENSTKDMSRFVSACDGLREQTRACVLLVHHCGHAEKTRARGSIALKGALDWEYCLAKDPSAVLHLICSKAKDAEPPPPAAFRLRRFDLGLFDEDGEPVTSAILEPAQYIGCSAKGSAGRGKNQLRARRVLLEALERERARMEEVGMDPSMASISVADWKRACLEVGLAANRFSEVARTMESQGEITVHEGRVSSQDPEFAVT